MDEFQQELIKTTVEQTVGAAYNDVAKPTATALGTVASLPIRTLRIFLSKWEKWIINGEKSIELTAEAVQKKIENIPPEKLCEPEPYIAVPAIQQLTYCYDNEILREMYANLLAQSMNIDTKKKVHPSFVEIIRQLSPDEAKLLSTIYPIRQFFPIVDVISYGANSGFKYVIKNFYIDKDLENWEDIGIYIDNLERLGIIEINDDVYVDAESIYKEICESKFVKRVIELVKEENRKIEYKKKSFSITEFGISFLRTCVFQCEVKR